MGVPFSGTETFSKVICEGRQGPTKGLSFPRSSGFAVQSASDPGRSTPGVAPDGDTFKRAPTPPGGMKVIVHGGAGGAADDTESRQATLGAAAEAGTDADSPLDAVEDAVAHLEADPAFNAGVGGAIQADGVVRTDAGLMNDAREVGAVCSVPGVANAVGAARVVLEETPHVLVSGEHAAELAGEFGVETDRDLTTEATRARWEEADVPDGDVTERLSWLREQGGAGTVGAVAIDERGYPGPQVAAATSTGGQWFALAGRVGDVPQVGAGFYATSAGGASATGVGEDVVRTLLSRRAVSNLAAGDSPQVAAERALAAFEDLTDSTAGLIVMAADGTTGTAFNSEAMPTAVARA
jgi:isoaspartyl peptidase/L-asparaginase-like protein (Ntn-hydrolase superfamily)